MTASPVVVPYALGADASHVAHAADRALEGSGVHVSVEQTEADGMAVWLHERGDMRALGYWFLPGQQLVVESGGAWRIEDAPAVTL